MLRFTKMMIVSICLFILVPINSVNSVNAEEEIDYQGGEDSFN